MDNSKEGRERIKKLIQLIYECEMDFLLEKEIKRIASIKKFLPRRDHACCFEQEKPGCGQKIEHAVCCICERINPKYKLNK